MKSIEEHNQESLKRFKLFQTFTQQNSPSGIECPTCGEELLQDNLILAIMPPQKNVNCPSCGYHSTIYA